MSGKKEQKKKDKSWTDRAVEMGLEFIGTKTAKGIATAATTAVAGKGLGRMAGTIAGPFAGTLLFPEELGDGSLPRFETPEQAWSYERKMADFRRQREEKTRAEAAEKAARKKEEEALSRETAAQREKRQMQEARKRAQDGTAQIMQQHEAKKREKAAKEQEQRNAMRGHPTIHIPD